MSNLSPVVMPSCVTIVQTEQRNAQHARYVFVFLCHSSVIRVNISVP